MKTPRLPVLLLLYGLTACSDGSPKFPARRPARQVTVAQLAETGPDSNAFVALRDFYLIERHMVFTSDRPLAPGVRDRGPWKQVFLLATLRNGRFHQRERANAGSLLGSPLSASDPLVLIVSDQLPNPEAIAALASSDVIEGMVTGRLCDRSELDGKFYLALSPARIDPSRIWVFEHGRQPASAAAQTAEPAPAR